MPKTLQQFNAADQKLPALRCGGDEHIGRSLIGTVRVFRETLEKPALTFGLV
jgi:hypothetical protein